MYDPTIGMMLSPDILVSQPFNTQNYNRYTYALNNPLLYTDPSGWEPEHETREPVSPMPYLTEYVHPYDDWGRDWFSNAAYDPYGSFARAFYTGVRQRNREAGPTFDDLFVRGADGDWYRRDWLADQLANAPTFYGSNAVFDAVGYWNSTSSYKYEYTVSINIGNETTAIYGMSMSNTTYDEFKDVLRYIWETGSENTKNITQLISYEYENKASGFSSSLQEGHIGDAHLALYMNETAVPYKFKFHSPANFKNFAFTPSNLIQDNFPAKKGVKERYALQIVGRFGKREPSTIGTIYFSDWEVFYDLVNYIRNGP